MKKISKAEFLGKYGHLRPGTYDITIERYDRMPELLENLKFLHIKKRLRAKKTYQKDLQNIIEKHGLLFKKINFFDFVISTINLREKTKFEFKNRNSIPLAPYKEIIEKQFDFLCNITFLKEELQYLGQLEVNGERIFKEDYINALQGFRLDRDKISINTKVCSRI